MAAPYHATFKAVGWRAMQTGGRTAPHGDYSFLRRTSQSTEAYKEPKALTEADVAFLSRMDADVEDRRRIAFISELRNKRRFLFARPPGCLSSHACGVVGVHFSAGKDPRFRPSMLEPNKPKFQTVTLSAGPIIKTHKSNKTALEQKNRGHKWGPLGGYW